MRDQYLLKLKLRDGAINLAQALSTQTSRDAKDKLQAVRIEQRDLLEVYIVYHVLYNTVMYVLCVDNCLQDLYDIEEELETKLGVFHVKILGLAGLRHDAEYTDGSHSNSSSGGGLGTDSFEVQLKLFNQKWKARCHVLRGNQTWQDDDVSHTLHHNDIMMM